MALSLAGAAIIDPVGPISVPTLVHTQNNAGTPAAVTATVLLGEFHGCDCKLWWESDLMATSAKIWAAEITPGADQDGIITPPIPSDGVLKLWFMYTSGTPSGTHLSYVAWTL